MGTSSVTDMYGMFQEASAFNQPLSFDTSGVTSTERMFQYASAFNQPLSFNTSSVTTMQSMFEYASAFNQPLSFDMSSVTDFTTMFLYASAFNQNGWGHPAFNRKVGSFQLRISHGAEQADKAQLQTRTIRVVFV